MTLFFYIEDAIAGNDLGGTAVRLGRIGGLAMSAEFGRADTCELPIDDPASLFDIVGLKAVTVRETASTPNLLYRGYTIARDFTRGVFVQGDDHEVQPGLIDLNDLLGRFLIHGNTAEHGNRPAETVEERLTWLLGSGFGSFIHDNGEIVYATTDMDAADYRGRYAIDVLGDCAEAAPGGYLFFLYIDPTNEQVSLYFHNRTYTGFASTLQISNVLSDVDSAITFAPEPGADLNRDPSDVWSGVQVNFGNGKHTFVKRQSTEDTFGQRETVIDRPDISSLNSAIARGEHFLDHHESEQDEITCVIKLPRDKVTLIRAGHRVRVKFSHLDGYDDWQWLRVMHCIPALDEQTDQLYNVTLVLKNPLGIGSGGGGQGPGDNTQPPVTPPFVQECPDVGFVQAFVSPDAGSTVFTFPGPTTIGNTVTLIMGVDPQSTLRIPDGWESPTGRLTIPFSLHLGGPAAAAAIHKTITLQDQTDPVSHIVDDTKIFLYVAGGGGPGAMWDAAGTGVVCIEHNADPSTVTYAVNNGAGTNISVGSPGGTFGIVGLFTIGEVIIGSTVTGYTEAGDFDNSGPEPWGGYSAGSAPAAALTLGAATEWGAIAIGYASAVGCTQPIKGQMVTGELFGTTNGIDSTFRTNYPYLPSSLHVLVGGTEVTPTELDPGSGLFSIPAIWAGTSGFAITGWYLAASDIATVATNSTPDPEAGLVTQGNIVVAQGFHPEVGDSLAYMRADANAGGAVPSFLADGDTFYVPEFHQALFGMTIDAEGIIEVDGYLVDVT